MSDPLAEQPRLRLATLADLDAMWSIEREVFGAEAWSRDGMREEITANHRVYLVLEESGEVRGYGGMLIVGEESDVQTIAIDPQMRGRGHGKQLMIALTDAAITAGATQTFLEVRADNEVAQALYASLGFEAIGVRPRYYQPDDVDAVVMKRELGVAAADQPTLKHEDN